MSRAEELADYAHEFAITAKDEEVAAELRRLSAVEAELIALKKAIGDAEPVAWIREWAERGEVPKKEKSASGRMAWPWKFKLLPVTEKQCMPDDFPLYTLKGIK